MSELNHPFESINNMAAMKMQTYVGYCRHRSVGAVNTVKMGQF